jgi:putative endonuclease
MSDDPRHQLGRLGERLAREHLERLGYAIVASNYRTRYGELDIVALDRDALVFVEVKTRRPGYDPLDAFSPRKRQRVRAMASSFLASAPDRPFAAELRFDAIGLSIDSEGQLVELQHLEAAF